MSMRQLKITKSITRRESECLEKYLHEIGRVELITPEEEATLAEKIKKGDEKALERLIKANLRFVVSVAKQYQNQGLTLPDLINEGNLGLIKAAQRFDETKGFRFISYAVWWIRQTILQAVADQGRIVRLPLSQAGLTNRITKARQLLEQEYEREPTVEELADLLEISAEEVATSLMVSTRHISFDSPLADQEENTLIDIMPNTNAPLSDDRLVREESMQMDIAFSLEALTERQKEVVCFFYGIGIDHPLSLEDIGKKYSLTRERIRQIKDKAITKLQTSARSKDLKVYMG